MEKYRAQVQLIGAESGHLVFEVPAWGESGIVAVSADDLPEWLGDQEVGYRCFARVNLDAETPDELEPTDWERREYRRPTGVPRIGHLRKMEARLERLNKMGLHDLFRKDVRFQMPARRDQRLYMEIFDQLIGRDLPELLEQLIKAKEQ